MINGALKRRPHLRIIFSTGPGARLFYLAFRAEMLLHDLVKFLGGVAPFLQPFFTALLAEDPLGPLLVGPVGEESEDGRPDDGDHSQDRDPLNEDGNHRRAVLFFRSFAASRFRLFVLFLDAGSVFICLELSGGSACSVSPVSSGICLGRFVYGPVLSASSASIDGSGV